MQGGSEFIDCAGSEERTYVVVRGLGAERTLTEAAPD